MVKAAVVAVLVVSALAVARARENDVIARFEGGIGVIPVTGGAGTPNADGTLPNVKLNVVRGVSPAGPWRIADLKAVVGADGHIVVKGSRLLLASGNSIGTNANASVFATLICDTASPFTPHNTGSVALDPNGNFLIEDTLDSVPAECASPVLLIRSSGSGVWFAAGIPKLGGD
jgi:hypothetical protein